MATTATDGLWRRMDWGAEEDCVIGDAGWRIRGLGLDTGRRLPGRKVLLSGDHVRDVRWSDSRASVDLSREGVRRTPGFDPSSLTSPGGTLRPG